MTESIIKEDSHKSGVVTLTLNQPKTRNALNLPMILALSSALKKIPYNKNQKVLVLQGAPWIFSAGADLKMMKGANGGEDSQQVGQALAALFYQIWQFPLPTLAVVEGPALGGGAGLVAACDMVIASTKAVFAFPEARLGLIPATISPYVVKTIGARHAQRLFLTGNRFSAHEALRIGLVDSVVTADAKSIQSEIDALSLECINNKALSHKTLIRKAIQ